MSSYAGTPGSPTGGGSVIRSGTVTRGNAASDKPTRKEFEVLIAKQLNAQQEQIREAFKDMVALITDMQTAQEALKALKDPIKKDSALVQLKGLSLLGALVKNCTHELPAALATKKWMDRLLKLLRISRDDRVKKKILQLLVDWDNVYKGQAQLQEFSIAIARLKAKNVELPAPSEKIEHRKPRRPKAPDATVSDTRTRGAAAPAVEQSAVMGTVEVLVMNAHADMSNLEIGLQRPEMLQEGIAEECRGHLRKIQNLLSADLPDAVTYELIVISDSLKELLGLFDALYTDSAPEEVKAERDANEMMKIEQEIEAEQQKRGKRERELEQLKEQLAKEREALKTAKAAKERERANRPLNSKEKKMEEAVSSTISKAAGVKDMARDVKRLLSEHRDSLVQANAGFNNELAKGLYAYPEHVEKARLGETKAFTTLKRLYTEECATRKKLYNKLQELRGNIRVYCRVRPMNTREKERGDEGCVSYPTEGEIVVKEGGKQRMYEFDLVFPPDTTQEMVFEDTKPLINCVIDGYKVCIFAYGQTGSGKTHTMTGPKDNPGINRRAVARLFELIEERRDVEDTKVQISVLEIYNERIHDLLNDSAGDKNYEIKTHPQDGQYVANLLAFDVQSLDQIDGHVAKAEKNRTQGKTNMNEHSSRSHMLLYIVARTRNLQSQVTTVGKLALVDLAGSERVNKSGATGDRMKEAQAINKSLSALGDVISSLSQNNSHVPYRNSKLTHLLQDSLGGSAKCLMFCNVSPASSNANESNNSLAFAFRARGVVLGPAKRNVQQEKE